MLKSILKFIAIFMLTLNLLNVSDNPPKQNQRNLENSVNYLDTLIQLAYFTSDLTEIKTLLEKNPKLVNMIGVAGHRPLGYVLVSIDVEETLPNFRIDILNILFEYDIELDCVFLAQSPLILRH
ncbi:MAG: hypothetical protein MR902_09000 [Campylobacter sp.]|nr:hypothetical protein [Campylobacter sp.]